MKLSNKKIRIITILMTIALSGLVVLQTILLKTALKSEEETFQSNINLVLHNVVNDLMSSEARSAVMNIVINDSTAHGNNRIIKRTGLLTDSVKNIYMFHDVIDTNMQHDSITSSFKFTIENFSDDLKVMMVDSGTTNHELTMTLNDSAFKNGNVEKVKYRNEAFVFQGEHLSEKDSSRIMLIEAALTELQFMDILPIDERLDTLTLDSAIAASLKKINIELDYSFAVTNARTDSMLLSVRNPSLENLSKSPYKTILFPGDFLVSTNFLILDFPNKQFFIFSKLMSLILPTLFFMLIIITIFIYAIKLILGQRKTAVRLTDFINNMTHEFKTPISTIQLASEAISKNEVFSNKEKMLSFNKMILSENKRMQNQVDKILQIATLEEGDYILSIEQLDMHKLIDEAIESFSILLKQQNGTIIQNLQADNFEIDGDRVHLLNVICNLIDNALKYSKDNPEISIATKSEEGRLEISVKDKGIGIHPDDMKFVFDKYYRVGNVDVHDIKGFGLGLSYVKMMVEAHDGSVQLLSSLDKGTEVIISLPLK